MIDWKLQHDGWETTETMSATYYRKSLAGHTATIRDGGSAGVSCSYRLQNGPIGLGLQSAKEWCQSMAMHVEGL